MGVALKGFGGWMSRNLGALMVGFQAGETWNSGKQPQQPSNTNLDMGQLKPFMPIIILVVLVSMLKK